MAKGKHNETILTLTVVWLALEVAGWLPPAYTSRAVNAALRGAAAPYVAWAVAHVPLPAAVAAALALAVGAYLWAFPSVPVVRIPELAAGPIPARRVADTALALPSRPGMIQCYSPSTLQFLGEVPVTTPEGVRAAVSRARALQPGWAATSFAERRRVLRMMQAATLAHAEEIVRISCIDTGKPRVDAQFGEILSTAGKLDWVIGSGEDVLAPETRATNLTSAHKVARVEYHPLGVIGVIAPWNYPFYNLMNHIASGLFAGNAVVLKISEYSAWSAGKYVALARGVLAAAGYSPDLVQLVQGFGDTGAALVNAVDKVIFTGSPGVGKAVMKGASSTLTPLVLELGGKDPLIVCDDADVDSAVTIALRGTFQNSGQNCVGIERIYVYESVHDAFVAQAVGLVKRMRTGPPVDPLTGAFTDADMGAITTAPQLALIQELVDDAVVKGATLHAGGRALYVPGAGDDAPATARGLFYPPTVLSGVTHAMRIANEEVFGPVMAIFRVDGDSDDAAVAMANATAYGLSGTVFSGSPSRANAIARRLRSGMVGVNAFGLNYLVQDLPFGGVGASGYDRFSGPEGLRSCCLVKSVVTDVLPWLSIPTPTPAPLCYPLAPNAPAFTRGLIGFQFESTPLRKLGALAGLLSALASGGKAAAAPATEATAAAAESAAPASSKKRK